jgi:ABC-type transporter Mla maintaining outer membrane lipid asymmetry permease subunit MlaE
MLHQGGVPNAPLFFFREKTMKRMSMMVVVAGLLFLGACAGQERATVTGGYGAGVLTGEVVMASGVSPLGVEVTVRGTGMTSAVDADGRFAFASVPEEAELDFRRAADGIEASLRLEQSSGHVVVDLAQTTARKSGRRRAAGGGTRGEELRGVLQSASATQIVVDTATQTGVVIALTPQTVLRRGGRTITAADLVAGLKVEVKAQKVNDVLTALTVNVEDEGDDDAPAVKEYEGTVVSATATDLVLHDLRNGDVTFSITAATDIRKGNMPVAAADIQPGWRVHVKADADKVALRIIIQSQNGDDDEHGNGGEVKVNGQVTAVGTAELTVQAGSASITVKTDAATRIEKKGQNIALADIHAGDSAKIEGTRNGDGSVLAKEIEVKSR